MRKIPTLFVRDEANRSKVTDRVTPGCEWVLAGEGVPTRKYDGTCVVLDADHHWWARREVKRGKTPPPRFTMVGYDDVTGKMVGWEPISQSGFAKFHSEATRNPEVGGGTTWEPGTYELCGPRINGGPDGYERHVLVRHATAAVALRSLYGPLRPADLVRAVALDGWEGP